MKMKSTSKQVVGKGGEKPAAMSVWCSLSLLLPILTSRAHIHVHFTTIQYHKHERKDQKERQDIERKRGRRKNTKNTTTTRQGRKEEGTKTVMPPNDRQIEAFGSPSFPDKFLSFLLPFNSIALSSFIIHNISLHPHIKIHNNKSTH